MATISKANLQKTFYYLQRNGIRKTWYAAWERWEESRNAPYAFRGIFKAELRKQRAVGGELSDMLVSIVVPTYCTKEKYLREMIDSCVGQSYPHWELILADATPDDSVRKVVETYDDSRIRYIKLERNDGIAENTNRGLEAVTGAYVGLLDHDDVLEPDALYEMVKAIKEGQEAGIDVQLLYSDEDKCNEDRTWYFEPHYKENFNYDLLLTNNYFCHFLVMKAELICKLGFRKEYDGAQDYDLVLRAVREILPNKEQIVHIPRMLYHWRCHEDSTAQNPRSKQYAYDAGRRAVQDYVNQAGWKVKVVDTPHVGFYRLRYEGEIWESRPEIGAVGGRVVRRGKVHSGRMSAEGNIYYQNINKHFSGYMNRVTLQQSASAVDIRCVRMKPECYDLFEKAVGVPYVQIPRLRVFDTRTLPEDADTEQLSVRLAKALREAGYQIVWEPRISRRVKHY